MWSFSRMAVIFTRYPARRRFVIPGESRASSLAICAVGDPGRRRTTTRPMPSDEGAQCLGSAWRTEPRAAARMSNMFHMFMFESLLTICAGGVNYARDRRDHACALAVASQSCKYCAITAPPPKAGPCRTVSPVSTSRTVQPLFGIIVHFTAQPRKCVNHGDEHESINNAHGRGASRHSGTRGL